MLACRIRLGLRVGRRLVAIEAVAVLLGGHGWPRDALGPHRGHGDGCRYAEPGARIGELQWPERGAVGDSRSEQVALAFDRPPRRRRGRARTSLHLRRERGIATEHC